MAEVKGPVKIILTIEAGFDKDGRMSVDWSAEAEVPKGVEAPRIDMYMAKEIMECAEHCMNLKDSLNWRARETAPQPPPEPDQLP